MSNRVSTRIVTLADRPDLIPEVTDVLPSRWPAFILQGHPGHEVDLPELLTVVAPAHQVALLDDRGTVIGAGFSVPHEWDQTTAGLPAGWDAAVTASAAMLAAGRSPSAHQAVVMGFIAVVVAMFTHTQVTAPDRTSQESSVTPAAPRQYIAATRYSTDCAPSHVVNDQMRDDSRSRHGC